MLTLYCLLMYCKLPLEVWGPRKAWGYLAIEWAVVIGLILLKKVGTDG